MARSPKLFAVFKDISQRKQSEQESAKREQHLQAILKAIPECIKTITELGVLEDMTPAGLAMLEAENLEQAKTKALIDYAKPEYRSAFHVLYNQVFEGKSGTLEFEVVGLKGGERWLETNAVYDETGKVVKLLGATRDVTTRKQAELEHARLAANVEHTDDAIISTTLDDIITS